MNRTTRTIIAVIFILIITFCAISICQNIGKSWKVDVTQQKLYTLSNGTKAVLAKLNKPIKVKLFYAKTAALKGPDQIKYFNNYYEFVKSLLEEYAEAANGMIDLQVIDPRPFSEEESQAMRYGLKRFPISEEENFFFGLVVQTSFGVEKSIPFFKPDRQKFVEYDISYLIETAITRQKNRIGVLSSLPVMGDNVSGYMAQMMRMQGKQPRQAWTFIEQLKQQYEVKKIETDANEISDIDILLVIHPKKLKEQTIFAIDQFILKGGRAVICVDPYCFADQPDRQKMMQMRQMPSQSSELNRLFKSWNLEMPADTFAGDRSLAISTSLQPNSRPEKIIGFLGLNRKCFNPDSVITSSLNQVTFLFAGVLKDITADSNEDNQIKKTPIVMTTNRGNTFSVSNPYELMRLDPQQLMKNFSDGTKPVVMGYFITGRFRSSFPDGINVKVTAKAGDANEPPKTTTKHITGLTEATSDCAVAVFTDVDFISDMLAYQSFFFGKTPKGDNAALMTNVIDDLGGSKELISIRSRGNFKRPFAKVDEIEAKAEAETAQEEAKVNAEIQGFQNELQTILSSAKQGQEEVIGSSILKKKKVLELKIHQARKQLNDIKLNRRQKTEALGNMLRNINMLTAPIIILLVAIILSIYRRVKKRHYISHFSK